MQILFSVKTLTNTWLVFWTGSGPEKILVCELSLRCENRGRDLRDLDLWLQAFFLASAFFLFSNSWLSSPCSRGESLSWYPSSRCAASCFFWDRFWRFLADLVFFF